jgi:HYR domain-containing protein
MTTDFVGKADGATAIALQADGKAVVGGSAFTTSDFFFDWALARYEAGVIDETPPVITVPDDVTAAATGPDGAIVNYTASAVDLVDGPVPVTCVPAGGSTFPIGTTTVTCAASDIRGNSSVAQFAVTITDHSTPGRMDGEGYVDQGAFRYGFDFQISELADGSNRGHFRLTLYHAVRENRDEGCDGHDNDRVGGHRNRFEARRLSFVRFSDDPGFVSGRGASRRVLPDTLVVAGTGRWNRQDGYFFEVYATDKGEPGRGRDTFSVIIWTPNGNPVVTASLAAINAGNIQATPLGGGDDRQ